MRAFLLLFLTLMLAFYFTGCGSTQDHRRRQYSRAFAELPESVQEAANAGYVFLGMPREGVYVALGAPLQVGDMRMPEFVEGTPERWYYFGEFYEIDSKGKILFKGGYDRVFRVIDEPTYLVIDFLGGSVSQIWHMDRSQNVLESWP